MIQRIYKYRFYILGLLFLLNTMTFWPGYIQYDSQVQYNQAVSGQYTDHHPPMMSFIWHYLDRIHQGEGLMFGLQMLMLYSAVAVLLLTLDKLLSKEKRVLPGIILLLLPLYPQVLVYSVNIVKDVQYAFSFLLAGAILAYYTAAEKRPSFVVLIALVCILIYGSAVKYQGQFCVIVLSAWLGALLCLHKNIWYKIAAGVLVYGVVFFSIGIINDVLVPQKSKNYSWQFVKLYDLAAISINANQDLIPEFNKTPAFTFKKLQDRFLYPTVDPYIYSEDNIFTITKDPSNMSALYSDWLHVIAEHPVLYLKHRIVNMCYALLSRPGYDYALSVLNKIPQGQLYTVASAVTGILFYAFMSHLFVVMLGGIYFIYALMSWRYSKAAPILLGFSSIALLMVAILFFMSMAGVPRYTYIAIIMLNFSHIFAYTCYQDRKAVLASKGGSIVDRYLADVA